MPPESGAQTLQPCPRCSSTVPCVPVCLQRLQAPLWEASHCHACASCNQKPAGQEARACEPAPALRQVTRGDEASAALHTVFAATRVGRSAIGTLEKGRVEQLCVDYPVAADLTLSHSGASPVYITGCKRAYLPLGTHTDGAATAKQEVPRHHIKQAGQPAHSKSKSAGDRCDKVQGPMRMSRRLHALFQARACAVCAVGRYVAK